MLPRLPHTAKENFKDRPVELDDQGTLRFRSNRVVRYLLDEATEGRKCDMKHLWRLYSRLGTFTEAEMREFYQLIGYSQSGFDEVFDVEVRD
jgi:hypothetical protein